MPAAPAPRNPSLSVSFILLPGSHFVFSIESQTGKEVVGVDEQHAKKKMFLIGLGQKHSFSHSVNPGKSQCITYFLNMIV